MRDILDPSANAVMEQLAAVLVGRSKASNHGIDQAMIAAMVYITDAGRICRPSGGTADPNDVDKATLELIVITLDGICPRAAAART